MTLPATRNDREYKKFFENLYGDTVLRVAPASDASPWIAVQKTLVCANVAGSGRAGDTITLFTVTGMVKLKLYCYCSETCVSADSNSIDIGTALSLTGLIASPTGGADDLVATEIWHDATPDKDVELSSVVTERVVVGNIIATVGAGASGISDGTLVFVCVWTPQSYGASVVAA